MWWAGSGHQWAATFEEKKPTYKNNATDLIDHDKLMHIVVHQFHV